MSIARVVTILFASILVGSTLSVVGATSSARSVTGSEFMPGLIITDSLFYDGAAMTEADIQLFLASKGSGLAGYTFTVASRPAVYSDTTGNLRCNAFTGGTNLLASTIIYRAQVACGISAKVILVTLQKEQGLITKRTPSQAAMDRAMGYACPDTAPCAPTTLGFGNQVYSGALQLNTYKQSRFGRQPGTHAIQYNPNAGCGSSVVNIQNYATAALYNYTPYQPNAAALANLGGTGDSCSSYGNRNFWYYYQSWFGSPLGNTPYPVVSPGIAGTSELGTTLTVNPGIWRGSPDFAYQWVSCDSSPDVFVDGIPNGCNQIDGATTSSYVSTSAVVGKYVAVVVKGTNASGSMTAGAFLSARVGAPVNLVAPTMTGRLAVGAAWTVDIGTWTGIPAPTMAIHWLRCSYPVTVVYSLVPTGCAAIEGATDTVYVSTPADVGKYITAQVAGNSPLGFSILGTLSPSPVGLPDNTSPPTATGGALVGSTWSVNIGTWTGTPPPTIAIHWLRCAGPVTVAYALVPAGCVVIGGATGPTYVSSIADVGMYLTAQVAGNNSLGFSIVGTLNSVPTQAAVPVNTVPPTVSGAGPVGSTWTVDTGEWTGAPAPTIAIHWLRCMQPITIVYSVVPSGCAAISGATDRTYVSTSADVGRYLTAQVAGNSPLGYSIVGTLNSVATQAALPVNTTPPSVSGGAPIGSTWTVDIGSWTGAQSIAIHWLRCVQPVTSAYSLVPSGCAVIVGATGKTYVSTSADVGRYLTAQIAGNSPFGFSIVGTLNSVATEADPPVNLTPPTTTGDFVVGSIVTVNAGTWSGVPAPAIAIHWLRCAQPITVTYSLVPPGCVAIEGATAASYTPTSADIGWYLTAQVAGNSVLGFAIAGTLNSTVTSASAIPANVTPPTTTGSYLVGSTLTVDVGTWTGNPVPEYAIHWLRCDRPITVRYSVVPEGCTAIAGATATTYTQSTSDVGYYLSAQVAGNSKLGFAVVGTLNSTPTV